MARRARPTIVPLATAIVVLTGSARADEPATPARAPTASTAPTAAVYTMSSQTPALLPPGIVAMPPGYMDAPGRWPRRLEVDDARLPPPLGYRLSVEPRAGLWISGTTIFASSYGIAAAVGGGWLASDEPTNELGALLLIPLLGPAIFSVAQEPITTPSGRLGFVFGALGSAIEGTGFGLLLAGFVFPRPVYLRNDVDGPPSPTVSLAPSPSGMALHATW